jgi:pectate lyase
VSNAQYIVSKALKAACILLIGIALSGNMLIAAVTVTPATGGTNISADNAANAATPAWTTLGNIVITEGAKTDFATGTGVTLILTSPAGWEFNTGASVSTTVTGGAGGQNVAVTNVAIASSTITLTLTVSATTKTDILTIIGVQIRSTEGGNLPASGNILRTAANPGTATITGITNNSTNFGSLSQVIG